jgi:predicted dehydrogenase
VRIGIIGCGLIGRKRAAAARHHDIVMVCDVDPGRAEALGAKCGARAVTAWREVVSADVEAVIVATTHDTLAPIALAAVEAGHHLLVEKPAARATAELAPVVAAAEESGRTVKVGFNHRFHPGLRKAREMVVADAIGPLLYIRGRYGHGGRKGYEDEWRCRRAVSGGGELIDQGSHLIDLARWFLGDLEVAFAETATYFWPVEVEDNCFLVLRSRERQLAWLHASWTEWKNTFSFEIFGRDGKLAVDGLGGSYGVERLTHHRMSPQMGPPETTIWEYPFPDQSWDLEFAEFVSAIEERRQPLGNLSDALMNLHLIENAYRRGLT